MGREMQLSWRFVRGLASMGDLERVMTSVVRLLMAWEWRWHQEMGTGSGAWWKRSWKIEGRANMAIYHTHWNKNILKQTDPLTYLHVSPLLPVKEIMPCLWQPSSSSRPLGRMRACSSIKIWCLNLSRLPLPSDFRKCALKHHVFNRWKGLWRLLETL